MKKSSFIIHYLKRGILSVLLAGAVLISSYGSPEPAHPASRSDLRFAEDEQGRDSDKRATPDDLIPLISDHTYRFVPEGTCFIDAYGDHIENRESGLDTGGHDPEDIYRLYFRIYMPGPEYYSRRSYSGRLCRKLRRMRFCRMKKELRYGDREILYPPEDAEPFPEKLSLEIRLSPYVRLFEEYPDCKVLYSRGYSMPVTVMEKQDIHEDWQDVLEGWTYDRGRNVVQCHYRPDYEESFYTTLWMIFNIRVTEEAYEKYARNCIAGKDRYMGMRGDEGTDIPSSFSNPEAIRSSNQPGFYAFRSAKWRYQREGDNYSYEFDRPVVKAEAPFLQINKVNALHEEQQLPGAEFDLYQEVSQAAQEKGIVIPGADEGRRYIKVNDKTICTDKDGKALIVHLRPGEYWLREIRAPEGFARIDEAFPIWIHDGGKITASPSSILREGSHGRQAVCVGNRKSVRMPETGGNGDRWKIWMTGAGMILLGICIRERKR